jgi:hypothetical protein
LSAICKEKKDYRFNKTRIRVRRVNIMQRDNSRAHDLLKSWLPKLRSACLAVTKSFSTTCEPIAKVSMLNDDALPLMLLFFTFEKAHKTNTLMLAMQVTK